MKHLDFTSYHDHPLVMPEPNSGCWIWMGAKLGKGHGCIRRKGKTYNTHRFFWTLEHGPIPDGLWVLHKCNNAACVNPDHLYLGTHRENMADMKRSGRRLWKNAGALSGTAKLNDELVRKLRDMKNSGKLPKYRDLSKLYGVSVGCLRHAVVGLNWRHV